VQRGLGSRAYDRGRFSVDFEEGVYMFQVMLKEAYRRVLSGPPAAAAPPPSLAPERRR